MDAGMGDRETEEGNGQSPTTASAFESSVLDKAPSTSTQKAAPPRTLDSLKWDEQLHCDYYFNAEQLKKWQLMNLPSAWNEEFAFPSPGELTAFADAAYDETKNKDYEGWKVVMTAGSSVNMFMGVKGKTASFFARVYFNEVKRQLLVAIKGTGSSSDQSWQRKIRKFIVDLMADTKNVLCGKGGLQVDSVFTFGEKLRKLIEKLKCNPQVIITGHSLGGFLAQVLTFTLRNCGIDTKGKVIELFREDFGLNTIVFDSPAAFKQIKRIAKNDPLKASCVNLPITNFIIELNRINDNLWIGSHVGIVISLSKPEDLKTSSKWRLFKNPIAKHGSKNFMNANFDQAHRVVHLESAEVDKCDYDSKRIPLLQFSQSEQDALRLLPLTTTIHMNSVNLIPSSSFTIQDNEVVLTEDQGAKTFIPRLRLFVQNNDENLRDLADNLHNRFNVMMQSLLNAHAKDFNDLDLWLKPEIPIKYRKMATGSSIIGLADAREQMLLARILKNSLENFFFVNFDDFIGVDKLQRETWLRINVGTLMLCQANGRRLDENHDRKTKIFYLDSANAHGQSTFENISSLLLEIGPEEQESLKVTDLDEESRRKLKERKLGFLGNQVKAGKIFLGLFKKLKVRDVIDFTYQRKDQELNFYFQQSLRKNGSYKECTVQDLVSEIQKADLQTLFLISCNAGMGKSTNLKKFAKSLQETLPHFWVVRLELASCSESLQKWKLFLEQGKSRSTSNTAQWQKIFGKDNSSSSLYQSEQRPRFSGPQMDQQTGDFKEAAIAMIADEIFKGASEKDAELQRKVFFSKVAAGEVIFVLDAVDEVCPLYRKATLELLRQLKKARPSILVATRPQEENEVAQALGIKEEDILRINLIYESDQAQFIHDFWDSKGISSDLETAQSLLDQLESRLPAGVPGVPLNLRMIAESFPDGKLSEEFRLHGDLYKALFEISIREAIKNKFGLDYTVASQRNTHMKIAEEYFTLLQKIAVTEMLRKMSSEEKKNIAMQVFDCFRKATKYVLQKVTVAYGYVDEKSLSDEEIEFINRLPFAVVVGAEVRFIHKTFQEYLIAVQLVRVMKGEENRKGVFLCKNKCERILVNRESREIRAFIDTILSDTSCSAPSAKALVNEEVVLICLEEQRTNMFKLLCYDQIICNNRIGKGKKHPLEVILDNKQPNVILFEYLISQGARLEDVVNERNRVDMLRRLIRVGLNKIIEEKWNQFESTLEAVYNPLVSAAECRNRAMARFLIQRDACVDMFDRNEIHTPLSAAIENDDLELVQLLIKQKATVTNEDFLSGKRACLKLLSEQIPSINVRDVNGKTLLMRAAEKGNVDCVRFLLDEGLKPKEMDRKGRTCLYYALKENIYDSMGDQNDFIKIFFELLAPSQEEKNKLLFVAAEESCNDMLQFLLKNGANRKAFDENENNALHIAAGRDILNYCTQVLLRGGADLNAKNKEGRTPLHRAAASGRDKNCKALLEAKVQVNIRDNKLMTPLMLATRNNYYRVDEVLKLFVAHGADPSLQDDQGWNCLHHAADVGSENAISVLHDQILINSRCRGELTPLMIAARKDNSYAVQMLLKNGADSSLTDELDWNCLHHAAANGSDECVKILRRKGVSLASRTNEGKTAFQLAEENGFVLTAQHLLRDEVEMDKSFNSKELLENAIKENDAETIEILFEKRKKVSTTEFVLAAWCGHLNLLELFVQLVESVDVKDKNGNTALMKAAYKNHVECVRFLLEKRADPNEKDNNGNTNFNWAAQSCVEVCVEMLFDRLAEENGNLDRLLHLAALFGNRKTLLLVVGGADLSVLDEDDNTCLHLAAMNKNPECLVYLLQDHLHQFDINARNKNRKTPLHYAAWKGGVAHLQLLVNKRADAAARDEDGRTALHFAADYGCADNCKFLSQHIPIDSKDFYEKRPLMLAAESDKEGASRVIKVLLDAGADPNMQHEDGQSCLHLAAWRGRLENVKVLCERGVPLEAKNKWGETALQLAKQRNCTAVVDFLRAKIADSEIENWDGMGMEMGWNWDDFFLP